MKTNSTRLDQIVNTIGAQPGVSHTAITKQELQDLLLKFDGQTMRNGRVYDIVNIHLGAGVYRVYLVRQGPLPRKVMGQR